MLGSGSRVDGHLIHRGVDEQGRGAACTVARDLRLAAIGIQQTNGVVADENPAVGADAGVAIADGAGCGGKIELAGKLVHLGQQEIVSGAVRFYKRDWHG